MIRFMWSFGSPLILLLTLIVYALAIFMGFKKGKKSGYRLLSVFWLIVGIKLALLILALAHAIPSKGMGRPEFLGQTLCSIFDISSYALFMTIIFCTVLAITKFNKSDLIQEVVTVVISGLLIFGNYSISKSFAQVAAETEHSGTKGFAGQAAGESLY